LDGGVDGLDILRILARVAPRKLVPDGCLMAEFGDEQESSLAELFAGQPWKQVKFQPDNSGRPRILIAQAGDLT